MHPSSTVGSILLVGASRGLGLAMAAELAKAGWSVVGTVRGTARTGLHDLAEKTGGRLEIETVDITRPEQISALRLRLVSRVFDVLFVNSGTVNANAAQGETIAQVSTEEFARVMNTNALGPMRAVECLGDLVRADGLIGVMSSGQGSVAGNTNGGAEVYRASKAALNTLMRSYAARHAADPRALVLMAPGWIRTALGGPNAPFTMEETVPKVVQTLLAQRETPGLRYVDRDGATVPW